MPSDPMMPTPEPPNELEILRAHAASLHSLQQDSANFVLYQLAVDPSQPHGARVVLVSPSITEIVGIRDPYRFESWFENVHLDDLAGMLDANRRALENGEMYNYPVRVYNPSKDSWVWVRTVSTPVVDARGKVTHYNGVILDITPQKQAEAQAAAALAEREAALEMLRRQIALEAAQSQFLELLTREGSFGETLHALVRIIEEQCPAMLGLILLLDEDGRHLHHGAAVSLPEEYCRSIEGLEIGPAVGSCGTAAFTRRRVVVEDIAIDPRWEGLRDLGLKYGLRSCWSQPVLAADGHVLGTFAMYYLEPRAPSEAELHTIEVAAHLARVAIEYKRSREALAQAYATLERRVEERTREIERRRQVAESMREILTTLNSNLPLGELLGAIVGRAVPLLDAQASALFRLQGDGPVSTAMIVEAVSDPLGELRCGQVLPMSAGPAGEAPRKGRVLEVLGDAAFRWSYPEDTYPADRTNMTSQYRAMLGVPLLIKEEVYGALAFYYTEPRGFSEEDVRLGEAIGNQAGLAIENARLRAQAEATAVATERSRIARDLHDSVTQTLFSANLIAGVLPKLWERNPQDGRRRLEQLHRLTSGALAEMRALLVELRPAALLEAPLGDLLRQLAEATTGRVGTNITCQVRGQLTMPPEMQVALYRIAQEALNNIAKHSRASEATVRLSLEPSRVELSVCDNGIGFDPASVPPDHLGVGIMQERAQSIGAQLRIDSRLGHGTSVQVMWQDGRP
jgi:PAS domain S-box-containing protein